MGASTDYCISNISRSSYSDRNWDDAIEIESKPFFERVTTGIKTWDILCNDTVYFHVSVDFDNSPKDRFQYFTSESITHDGTSVFVSDCIMSCVKKVVLGLTYFSNGQTPQKGDSIHYTVGNFVVLSEYGEFGTNEKPYLQERTTVLLPITMTCKREL